MKRSRKHNVRKNRLPLLVLLLTVLCVGGFLLWREMQPRFQNVVLELGDPMPEISSFLTEYADPGRAEFVTDTASVPVDQVGSHDITLRCGGREETVTLTVQDTLAPAVIFQNVTIAPGDAVAAEDFISEVSDPSGFTAAFLEPPEISDVYRDVAVKILVSDSHGNKTTGDCTLSYTWLRSSFTLELGSTLSKADILLGEGVDEALVDQTLIDAINAGGVGTYTVTSQQGDVSRSCTVTVADTVAPSLELQSVTIFEDQQAEAGDFVVSAEDASGQVSCELLTEPVFGTAGTQTVKIQAEDASGNVTQLETTLEILADQGPVFSGLEDIVLTKYAVPSYTQGVTATDDRDGQVEFTVDSSQVKLEKAGTYFITYSAVDSTGHETSMKRRIVVENDAGDTAVLVAQMAAQCGDDPVSMTDFVRSRIAYDGSDWGGEDPVYHGFTVGKGNCVVSAQCLLSLLEYKGYNAQLIWVKEEYEPHYWVIVEIEPGVWRHVDATRGVLHSKYDLMTDAMRLETLFGYGHQRYWDTSLWPACV